MLKLELKKRPNIAGNLKEYVEMTLREALQKTVKRLTSSLKVGSRVYQNYFFSWIEPVFLYGMCIGHTRSHEKFQTSGLKDLAWPPLFVNGSSRKSYKMT